jgi:ribosomal protein S18 acetylase RimI-like enzyme
LKPEIQPLEHRHVAACASILDELPEWFGIEAARRRYQAELPDRETYVAVAPDVLGFVALQPHSAYAAEIHLIAVRRDVHRQGVGRALVEHAEAVLRSRGVEYLSVKTLGPSHPDEGYAATRAFYASLGFRPLEETTAYWGEANPCLIMVMRL